MKISIITPSFNQAIHLRETLESVLNQRAADLEYIVVDGGSTDGSCEIINEYSNRLAWWCSEPDEGQYSAINKGFSKATGDILAWLNSSDYYLPWTLRSVLSIFEAYDQVEWISSLHKTCVEEDGCFAGFQKIPGFSRNAFMQGMHGSRENPNFIQQETCFWRRSLWEKIGGAIPLKYKSAADFHLWSLFFEHSPLTGVSAPLAAFRFHGSQRSAESIYMDEVEEILKNCRVHNSNPPHHKFMPLVYRNPHRSAMTTSRPDWVLDWIENDNFLFEMRDPDLALSQKEHVISALSKACEERLRCIEDLNAEINFLKLEKKKSWWLW